MANIEGFENGYFQNGIAITGHMGYIVGDLSLENLASELGKNFTFVKTQENMDVLKTDSSISPDMLIEQIAVGGRYKNGGDTGAVMIVSIPIEEFSNPNNDIIITKNGQNYLNPKYIDGYVQTSNEYLSIDDYIPNTNVDKSIFTDPENSDMYSMKRVEEVLSDMIKSGDEQLRTLGKNIGNLFEGKLTGLQFIHSDNYNKSAFAHYDNVSMGSGSGFILNSGISNEVTAHEVGHMFFGVLDGVLPDNYDSVISNALNNLENNKETVKNFIDEAIKYKEQFNAKQKEQNYKYFEEHAYFTEQFIDNILKPDTKDVVKIDENGNEITEQVVVKTPEAKIKEFLKLARLDQKSVEVVLNQFKDNIMDKFRANMGIIYKDYENRRITYENSLYDHQMQLVDMVTGVIDSVYGGKNPFYEMYVNSGFNGLRYHESSYFQSVDTKAFDEQFADYTAMKVYADTYAGAKTFLENVLGKEWFNMMEDKFSSIAEKISHPDLINNVTNANASMESAYSNNTASEAQSGSALSLDEIVHNINSSDLNMQLKPQVEDSFLNSPLNINEDGNYVFYHGGAPVDFSVDDIDVMRSSTKQGGDYVGFYMHNAVDRNRAINYTNQSTAENPGLHRIEISSDATFAEVDGFSRITRIRPEELQALKDQGVDVLVGKNPLGRYEYMVVNKDAIVNMTYEDPNSQVANTIANSGVEVVLNDNGKIDGVKFSDEYLNKIDYL